MYLSLILFLKAVVKEIPKPPPIKPATKTVPVPTVMRKKASSTPTKVSSLLLLQAEQYELTPLYQVYLPPNVTRKTAPSLT